MSYWKDKVVVVTGGSSGFGRALAEQFATCGARIGLMARDADRLKQCAAEIMPDEDRIVSLAADVTDRNQVDRAIEQTIEKWGRIDALAHCAGKSDRGLAISTSVERFDELMRLNFLGAVNCSQAVAPHLVKSAGHLIHIGSLASKTASRYLGAYPASKFALAGFSHQLRLELSPQGVHVMLVCPGPIARSDAAVRYDHLTGDLPEGAQQPGGGAKIKALDPRTLAKRVLRAAERRKPELIVPGKAKLLFAISQLFPSLGDWILQKKA